MCDAHIDSMSKVLEAFEPTCYEEAVENLKWVQAMQEKYLYQEASDSKVFRSTRWQRYYWLQVDLQHQV